LGESSGNASQIPMTKRRRRAGWDGAIDLANKARYLRGQGGGVKFLCFIRLDRTHEFGEAGTMVTCGWARGPLFETSMVGPGDVLFRQPVGADEAGVGGRKTHPDGSPNYELAMDLFEEATSGRFQMPGGARGV